MKVYLLYSINGDEFYPKVEAVCATAGAAEKEKQKIENTVKEIKAKYHSEYGNLYNFDYEWIMEDTSIYDERYDDVVHRVYDYQAKHSELEIKEMNIVERELIPDYLMQLKGKIPHERYKEDRILRAFNNLDTFRPDRNISKNKEDRYGIRIPKEEFEQLSEVEKEYVKVVMEQHPNVEYKWE